ncbi:MAG: DNA-directed RNA polymerase subunit beta, partial [Thermomicrobiales bacterium]|nr:DNA-directed RNA polymerase subunit beta [Thermomicrobiales bacterium]
MLVHDPAVMQVASNVGINRKSYAHIPLVLEIPNLVQIQLESFKWFVEEGLRELLEEISPIEDHHKKLKLTISDPRFDPYWTRMPDGPEKERAKVDPRVAEVFCRERDLTFSAPLRVSAMLESVSEHGEIRQEVDDDIFLGDFPMMTSDGTFIINGAERVVVSQLVRSPGVYLDRDIDPATGRPLAKAKLIPNRGAWLEFETSNKDVISVKVDRKRKMPVSILLRAVGIVDDEELLKAVADVDTNPDHHYMASTIDRENTRTQEEALIELYKRLRPGDPPTKDNARSMLENLFFEPRRYDLAKVGRYKLNGRLHADDASKQTDSRVLNNDDLIAIIREMILVNNGKGHIDDIDHLGNRRIRSVGELIQMHVRTGFQRLERGIRERMTLMYPEKEKAGEILKPKELISTTRPVMAAVREFFGSSQLSQFMDQLNPLAELTHKRRLSALGPGGLSRDRAGMDVRDVHPSHYGRICPIETPEGPNIGLIGYMASYGKINQYGFLETPYRRVVSVLDVENPAIDMEGQILREDATSEAGKVIVAAGTEMTEKEVKALRKAGVKLIRIRPVASTVIDYLSADKEEGVLIAQANTELDEQNRLVGDEVVVRRVTGGHSFPTVSIANVNYMDVSPKQVISIATALIPFLEHDDANRALMGANMQRQAVPLVRSEAPLVGTGMELRAAIDAGDVVVTEKPGVIEEVSADYITVMADDGTRQTYRMRKFARSNHGTCAN